MLEILDFFGIDSDFDRSTSKNSKINRPTLNQDYLKKIIRDRYKILSSEENIDSDNDIDAEDYQNHLVMTKQGKMVSNNKIINQY